MHSSNRSNYHPARPMAKRRAAALQTDLPQ
jgi:hypothetical protein